MKLNVQIVQIKSVDHILFFEIAFLNLARNDGRDPSNFFAILEHDQGWELSAQGRRADMMFLTDLRVPTNIKFAYHFKNKIMIR